MSKIKEILVQQMERLAEVAEDNRLDLDAQEKLTSVMASLSKEIRAWEQARTRRHPLSFLPYRDRRGGSLWKRWITKNTSGTKRSS